MAPDVRPIPDVVLRARGLLKVHGSGRAERRVLDGVDLDVAPGELVAIVGPVGQREVDAAADARRAGPRRTRGRACAVGRWRRRAGRGSRRSASSARCGARRSASSSSSSTCCPSSTARPTSCCPRRCRAPTGRRSTARGRALIARLGLADVAALRPHQLSGGEQQRFALARALVGDPPLVLADEPIGNLDASAGEVVLDLLRGIADEGRAVVMVTHQAEATTRADRVLRWRTAAGGDARVRWRGRRRRAGARDRMSVAARRHAPRGAAARAAVRAARRRDLAARAAGPRAADRVGVVAAGLVLGVALTVAYALSTGFDRAARARGPADDRRAVRRRGPRGRRVARSSGAAEPRGRVVPVRAHRRAAVGAAGTGRRQGVLQVVPRRAARLRDRRGARRAARG